MVDNTRPFFVLAIYIKPSLTKRKKDELIQVTVNAISKIKTEHANSYICIAGDFNRTPTNELEDLFHDIKLADSPPTRGDAKLDQILTKFDGNIANHSVNTFLQSDGGCKSDHTTLLTECKFEHIHDFEWVRYKTRMLTEEGKERFTMFFTGIDWQKLLEETTCPHESTQILHDKIESLNNICFPWKERKVKSTDKPWITDNIKRKIRRRKNGTKTG